MLARSLMDTRDIMTMANSYELGAMSKARRTVKLKGILPGTTSWVRILEDGRIEVEYYDRSAGAEDHFAGDVAWIYRISASERSHLYELLQKHTNAAITNDRTLLDAFVGTFKDAWGIRHWLKEKKFPFEEEFDSWP